VKKYLSLIKFAHSVFALPFAVIGFLLATQPGGQHFSVVKFLLMLGCMVTARSAAMAFNRYADRKIDARNPRTAGREIPKGIVSPRSALIFTVLNCALFIALTWFINKTCFLLSPVALVVILGYSFAKRYTAWCHLILGLGLSLAPIGAYLVVSGRFALLPVLFSLAVITWVSGFDIIYALPDEDFDKAERLHSMPAALGRQNAVYLSWFLHAASWGFVILAGIVGHLGLFYWIGALFYVFLLIYQHTLVKVNDLSRLNLAFFTMNGIASVVFAAFFCADYFFRYPL